MKIDRNIPIPTEIRAGRPREYPFDELQVGESFLVKNAEPHQYGSIRVAASLYGKEHKMKFTTRKTSEGVRVWRKE